MARIEFTKMHGCGNDYIYIDCIKGKGIPKNPEELARKLSDRHRGVGGDGIVLILPSDTQDAEMRIFNADGSEAQMCGNGVRCTAEYLFRRKRICGDTARIQTKSGIKSVLRKAEGLLQVDMGPASFEPSDIPLAGFTVPAVDALAEINGGAVWITALSMGNPHCVLYVSDVNTADVQYMGSAVCHSKWFPQGVNTEFVQVVDESHLKMRVWERGSGETQSCGTGACAAVAACVKSGRCRKDTDVQVSLAGGVLTVRDTGTTMLMTGDAVEVFTGIAEV